MTKAIGHPARSLEQPHLPVVVEGRTPPAHNEAERAILGALLLSDEQLGIVTELLAPEDFYIPSHRIIYQAIIEVIQQNKRPDLVTVQDELIKRSALETVGGLMYLIGLQEDLPSLGLIEQHARIIKEKATLRQLISSASSIIGQCYRQDNDGISSVLDIAEKVIFEISNKRTKNTFVQIDIWLKKTFQHLSDMKTHSKGVTGVASGYRRLDQMTSGFQASDLIVLAARPSMGKTALALCMAENAAFNGSVVGFFSLEMSGEQLALRQLSSLSAIPHHQIRNGNLTSQEWVELTNVAARLAQTKIFIDDTAMLDINELRAKARRLKAEHNLQLLVVDYLQLIHSMRRYENRHQEVSEISRSLKALAKELNIPIIALSQLSRAVDSRMDKRPILSDLRESGAIEQDADLIMFLYREVVYHQETEHPSQAELIIGKQRNGPTGTVFLNFIKELTKFEDAEDEY
jgi:replicative DNA helicase